MQGPGRLSIALLWLVAAGCAGCTSLPEMPWAPVARDASAGFYDTALLQYRLDAGKLGQPLDTVRVDGRHVGYEQIASSPLPDQSTGTLLIQSPHPAGRQGFARVTFSIDSSQEPAKKPGGWNVPWGKQPEMPTVGHYEEIHEMWAMDIPRAEADTYFELLTVRNFYNGEAIESGPAVLSATIDGRRLEKQWEQVPDLDALAQRVRRYGQLVAYIRPAALTGNTSTPIASTTAYRELLARTRDEASPGQGASGSATRVAQLPYGMK